jgi:hypothetical protein
MVGFNRSERMEEECRLGLLNIAHMKGWFISGKKTISIDSALDSFTITD